MSRPWLSIVIPTLNEAASIGATLATLDRPGVEVIVSDGGSTDDTPRIVQDRGVLLITSPRGRGPQLNAGAAQARGEVLLFLHADTRLPANFPEIVSRTLGEPGVALGAFRLRIDGSGPALRAIELGVRLRCAVLKLPYGDQAYFIRAEVFRALGGFAAIPLMEDLDLVRRARSIGAIRVVGAAAITSGRRWRTAGALRMSLINLTCATSYVYLGIDPARLAAWRDRRSR